LKVQVHERIGNKIYPRPSQETLKFEAVGWVVGTHCRRVTGGHSFLQATSQCQSREYLDKPRLFVIDLIAMSIDQQSVLNGHLNRDLEGSNPVFPGVLEMRNCAYYVDTACYCFLEQLFTTRIRTDTFLRKGHQLNFNNITHAVANLNQRVQSEQSWIRHVHMATDEEHTIADEPPKHLFRAGYYVLASE
jgi:hypothetical protein